MNLAHGSRTLSALQGCTRPVASASSLRAHDNLRLPSRDISAEKRSVALGSMLAAAAMTLLKLIAGLLSGSLGVLSDAAHSGLDSSAPRSPSSPCASATSRPTKTTLTATQI